MKSKRIYNTGKIPKEWLLLVFMSITKKINSTVFKEYKV